MLCCVLFAGTSISLRVTSQGINKVLSIYLSIYDIDDDEDDDIDDDDDDDDDDDRAVCRRCEKVGG